MTRAHLRSAILFPLCVCAVCCSVLQCVSVLQCAALHLIASAPCHSISPFCTLQCVAVCCSVCQCVAVCGIAFDCIVLQCVSVCCSARHYI